MTRPDTVGAWALVRPLGSGGMGTVYLARRADDRFEAEVAVKLLRPEMVATELSRRFRRERQILADLNHPGIARLLDGGETPDGIPWLAMEYVEGLPIDEHCTRHDLDVDERLRLFSEVCAAVRHAHGRLVVHTDLKPANVLVDREGRVRLLDFGIAKFLGDPDAAGDRSLTRTVLRPLTPAYASPEQIRGDAIATSTDVYSLGVLLYELLTGRLPYPDGADSGRELEDAILDHEPPPPSAYRPLDEDLDTIALKALHKDSGRRYASVDQLLEDVQRYRDGLPVRARPDTFAYRAKKFAERHLAAVSGTAATAVSVIVFGAVSALLAQRLEAERDAAAAARDEAEAVTEFLIDVFDATDPNLAQGLDLTARDILGGGVERVRTDLDGRPGVQSAVSAAIGEAYLRLGAPDSAITVFRLGSEKARESAGARSVEYASTLNMLGRALNNGGRLDEAEAAHREALEIFLAEVGPDAEETGTTWNNIGSIHLDRAELDEAEAAWAEALRIREASLEPGDSLVLISLNNLSTLYLDQGRFDDAVELSGRAVEGRRRIANGRASMDLARSLNNHAIALERSGRYDDAERSYLESLEIREQILEPTHPALLQGRTNLATLYSRAGRPAEAIPVLEDALEVYRAGHGQRMDLARVLTNYATALVRSGRHVDAVPALRESEAIIVEQLGAEHPLLGFPRQSLGDALHALERFDEAEEAYRAAVAVREPALGLGHPDVAFSKHKLGTFLLRRERLSEAAALLEEAMRVRTETLPSDHPDRIASMIEVGRLRIAQGRVDEGRALLRQAVEVATAARGPDDGQVGVARALLESAGEDDQG